MFLLLSGIFGVYSFVGAYCMYLDFISASDKIEEQLQKDDVLITEYNPSHSQNVLLCHDNKQKASILKVTQNVPSKIAYIYDFNASSTFDLCIKKEPVKIYTITYPFPTTMRTSIYLFNICFGLKNMIFSCNIDNILIPQSHCTTKVYRCLQTCKSAIMNHIVGYFRFFTEENLTNLTKGKNAVADVPIMIEEANLTSRRIYMFGDFDRDETQNKLVFVCKKMSTDKKMILSDIYTNSRESKFKMATITGLLCLSLLCYVKS
jgi:hypothetical protein